MDAADGADNGKGAALQAYLTQLATQRRLSPHTIDAYRRDLQELMRLSADVPHWRAVGAAEIRRYTGRLHAQGLAPRSIARKLSGWRGFFDWLGQGAPLPAMTDSPADGPADGTAADHVSSRGEPPGGAPLDANPVAGVRAPKRPKTLPKALSVDDAVKLVSTPARPRGEPGPADLCNRAMFELLYSSGLRVAELAGLDTQYRKADASGPASLGWIDLDEREVLVTGKGDKMRKVPVGAAALAALRAWLAVRPAAADGSAALFLSARASRISPRVVQLRLKAHGQAVGIPADVHPHMLRHSFASHVLQSSGDLRAVQEMLGHSSITSTQVYTALDFQHLALVYDKAHPRAKIK